jgi:predicted  nucleic acid-binding Zn-ribbon protein
LTEQLKVLDNDIVVIEKIYLFLGSVKDDESLIGKLFYAKQKKDMKRKKYVLNNQINRLKSKLNNLNEIVTKIEKIYLDKI